MIETSEFVQRARLWAHGFVPKSTAHTHLIPTLQRLMGTSFVVTTVRCAHCNAKQKVHVANGTGSVPTGRQSMFCI